MEADKSRTNARQSPAKKRSNVVKVLNWGDNPPMIVCLCGSTKFKSEFLTASRAFTLQGHVVVMPGVFGHADGGFVDGETKKKLDELHFRKIEMADIVYIINPRGYVGESTKREIEYAESLGKFIRYLES
jgi:hypothetical protein